MKKFIALLLSLAMCLSLCACGTADDAAHTDDSEVSVPTDDATPVSSEEPTAEPTSEPEDVSTDVWSIKYYVDNFKQPTDEWFITNTDSGKFIGTFCNSATSNSPLSVQVLVDEDNIAIALWEYSSDIVKNSSTTSAVNYDITMRTSDGVDHSMTGIMLSSTDRIFISSSYKKEVLNALRKGGDVMFYIVQSDRPTTTYLFTAPSSNFGELYSSIA